MDLTCYLHPGWKPLIRPAPATRAWMDNTPEAFAYRCLPLNIANAHGWEILTPMGFEARWNGGNTVKDVEIRLPAGAKHDLAPVSLFGQGVLTFHIFGLFRTPPGWNLWVGGSPNSPKDGIYPLSGIVETDWSPYTFTMNWRFTRPDHWVRFEAKEPVCFVYPVQRGYLDAVKPKLVPMEKNAELMRQFRAWSASRDQFQAKVAKAQPSAGADKWQKRYYRGVDMDDKPGVPDHQIKPRPADFAPGEEGPGATPAPEREKRQPVMLAPFAASPNAAPSSPPAAQPATMQAPPAQSAAPDPAGIQRALQSIGTELMYGAEPAPLVQRLIALGAPEAEARRIIDTAVADPLIVNGRATVTALRKRDWLLETMEKHWQLRPGSERIERRVGLSGEEFLDRYFAPGRPVVLVGEMADWTALAKWTPEYLAERAGARPAHHRRAGAPGTTTGEAAATFARLIDLMLGPGAAKDVVEIPLDAPRNDGLWQPFADEVEAPARIFERGASPSLLSLAPAGGFAPLRHSYRDEISAQVMGRRHMKIVAAANVSRLYNATQDRSELADLDAPEAGVPRFPLRQGLRVFEIALSPGEMLFLPAGWWHQYRAREFHIALGFHAFKWPNDWHRDAPA
jgi:hypothetical protein